MCLGAVGRVTRVWADAGVPMGLVRTGDQEAPVCLLYVPEAGEGDHPGEAEAAAALALRDGAADTEPDKEGLP